MQFQACDYKTSADAPRRIGIAKMIAGFGTYDVAYIVDGETGYRVPPEQMHSYELSAFPLSHIDTNYKG